MPQLAYPPDYLVPPSVERADGAGPAITLGESRGKLLVVTLAINHVTEHEALGISVWGSVSGTDWGARPLLSFPRKSYCGMYSAFLNLENHPSIRFLRVEWKMSRLHKRDSRLMFGFSVSLKESHSLVRAAVA